MRARRRTQKDGRGLEGALEGSEDSKVHSKEVRTQRCTQKNGRGLEGMLEKKWGLKGALERRRGLGHTLPWMVEKRWWKNIKRFLFSFFFFFLRPNSRGRPAQVKISQRWKISKSNFKLGDFKVAFHLMDLVWDFSCEVCKTHCPMSQSLDDMHASLPDLKYRPPFLLNLLVAWLMRTCYLRFRSSSSFSF